MNLKAVLSTAFLLLCFLTNTTTLSAQHVHGPECKFDQIHNDLADEFPNIKAQMEHFRRRVIPKLAQMNTKTNSRGFNTLYIPVVVHVIHQAGEAVGQGANLSAERIQAQIDVLNEDFSATNAGFSETPARWQGIIENPDIQFCLAAIDPSGNPTDGITRHVYSNNSDSYVRNTIKPATWWDSDLYYNIWTLAIPGTTSGGGTTGYAYIPYPGTIGRSIDGSVVDWRWFGGPGFGQSGYRTLTHEVGHSFGLFHPFQGESCSDDDGISDTPNQAGPTSDYTSQGCNGGFFTGPMSCGEEHMYVNYMDYSRSSCKTSFSTEQVNVMRAVLQGMAAPYGFGSRESLANNALAVCTFFDNDASISEVQSPTGPICDNNEIAPEVTLTNLGITELTTVKIRYTVDGGAPIETIWIDMLEPGESQQVTLNPFTPPSSNFQLTFYTTEPNGVVDEQPINDTIRNNINVTVPAPLPLSEDFADANFDPTLNGIYIVDPDADGNTWEREGFHSAYFIGNGSASFDNYSAPPSIRGRSDYLITPTYDFSTVSNASLLFDVAYAPYIDPSGNTGYDTLAVVISTDCGVNFDQVVYKKGGDELATDAGRANYFSPGPNDWRQDTVDLSAYDGIPNVTLAFVNISDYGNRMLLDNINVSVSCNVTITPNVTNEQCDATCDGRVALALSGGETPYVVQWDANAGSSNSPLLSDLCPGDYTVTVTDQKSCSAEMTITISAASSLDLTASPTMLNCNGDTDGSLTVAASGGNVVTDYQYLWSDPMGQTAAAATGLVAGTYTVTVTDDNDCSSTVEVEVMEPPTLDLMIDGENLACNGDGNGTATVNPSGGTVASDYTYLWSDADAQTTATATGLSGGTYTVTVTDDNNCSGEINVTIEEPILLEVSMNHTDLNCAGDTDGTATVSATGGSVTTDYTYLWNDANAQTSATATGLTAGTYTVTVTDDNNCSTEINVTIDQPAAIDLSGMSSDVSCSGAMDGTVTVTASGGTVAGDYTYLWSDGDAQTTATAIGLNAGTYTVTVTDDNGCSQQMDVTVTAAVSIDATATATELDCNGDSDAAASVSASGGTGSLRYLWSVNAQTTENITGLGAGTYTVTVFDANDCSVVEEVTIIEPTAVEASALADDASCFNAVDGSAEVTAQGGTGPYTYDIGGGSTMNSSFSALQAGSYVVTITDARQCTQIAAFIIDQPDELTASEQVTQPRCADDLGSITLSAAGGTVPYSYNIGGGASNDPEFSGLAAGTYTLTVTDVNGCTFTTQTEIISPDELELDLSSTPISCAGDANGSATVMVTGGTVANDYQYRWSDGNLQSSATATGLQAGVYTVVVSDDNGCTTIGTVTVNGPSELTVSTTSTDETTVGGMDGTATASPTGGTAPYQYLWSDPLGQMTPIANGLAPGSYTVTITDNNQCTTTSTVSINSFNCGNFGLELSSSEPLCNDTQDGSITVDPQNGNDPYDYDWSVAGASGATANGLGAGTYTVTVTDQSGCSIIEEVTLTSPPPIEINVTGTPETVAGANDGTATANVSGGTPFYSYQWNDPLFQTTQTATGLAPGTYFVVVVDDNNCAQNQVIIIDAGAVNCSGFEADTEQENASCNGANDGSIIVIPSGGTDPYQYNWSTSNPNSPTATGLSAGTYTVTITDENDCLVIETVTIDEPSAIDIGISSTDETVAGNNDGTATANPNGGTGNFGYQWSDPAMQTTQTATGLAPGTYTVTVSDQNNCTATTTVIINAGGVNCNTLEADTESVPVSCFDESDGSISVFPSGGNDPYQYNWSVSNPNSSTANGLSAGTYTVTITDANDCIIIETITVGQPPLLVVGAISTDETSAGSNDGTATAVATGGTGMLSYQWSDPAMQTTQVATGLAPGTYTVTVTDENDCASSFSVTVNPGGNSCAGFSGAIQSEDALCNGGADGTATAIGSGGQAPYQYLWSNQQSAPTITGLSSGIYVVTITDDNGCSTIQETMIDEPLAINMAVNSTDETNAGANDGTAAVIAGGGVGTLTYLWSNGSPNTILSGLMPGTYTVTVTDGNGCTNSQSVVVNPGGINCSGFESAAIVTPVSCNGGSDGSATASGSGGTAPYGFSWSSGQSSPSLQGLAAGTYTVTVSDDNGCISIEEIVIQEPPALGMTTTSTEETGNGASDGTATATASGGTPPYSFVWSNGMMGGMITGLVADTYTVTVTDGNNCSSTMAVEVSFGGANCASFGTELFTDLISCFGGNDGTATASGFGGTEPYTYSWSNNQMGSSINGLIAGTYTVTVTDVDGCVSTETITVEEPALMGLQLSGFDGNCGTLGAAQSTVTGGTSPYTYAWSNGATGSGASQLAAGVYGLTVTDANGCTVASQVSVETNDDGVDADGLVGRVTCFGDSDGFIDLEMLSGTPPFVFEWNNGATTEDLDDLDAGIYTVFITDGNDCSYLTTFVVGGPVEMGIDFTQLPPSNGNNGQIIANAYGGTPPYSYNWSTGSTSVVINDLSVGTYAVTITDANGCTFTDQTELLLVGLEELTSLRDFQLYPNPTRDEFRLLAEFNGVEDVEITLYNMVGQEVYSSRERNHRIDRSIDLRNFAQGTYLLRLRTPEGQLVKKVVRID
ncbi:MAG: T9SS type A sorting domain-containing protein [Bacteroidota bacterium]